MLLTSAGLLYKQVSFLRLAFVVVVLLCYCCILYGASCQFQAAYMWHTFCCGYHTHTHTRPCTSAWHRKREKKTCRTVKSHSHNMISPSLSLCGLAASERIGQLVLLGFVRYLSSFNDLNCSIEPKLS